MSDGKFMNGKIRVVENIGDESENSFGEPGTILTVIDGAFEDIEGCKWKNVNWVGFEDVKQINERFSEATVFELVEE